MRIEDMDDDQLISYVKNIHISTDSVMLLIELVKRFKALKAEFRRMENNWRDELDRERSK